MSATIGPCLAKLDPAVAQAVQSKFQVCIHFSNFLFLKGCYFEAEKNSSNQSSKEISASILGRICQVYRAALIEISELLKKNLKNKKMAKKVRIKVVQNT